MKKILIYVRESIKLGLMLLGAVAAIHIAIVVIHNATSMPTPPPGGWKPLPGDENYESPKK